MMEFNDMCGNNGCFDLISLNEFFYPPEAVLEYILLCGDFFFCR